MPGKVPASGKRRLCFKASGRAAARWDAPLACIAGGPASFGPFSGNFDTLSCVLWEPADVLHTPPDPRPNTTMLLSVIILALLSLLVATEPES